MSAPETQAAGETATDAVTIPAAAFDRDAAEGDAARDAADPPAAVDPDDDPWEGADVGVTWDLGGGRVAAAEAAAAAESERAIAENRRLCDALDALTNAGLALATTASLAQAVAAGARPDPWQPDRTGDEE
jgi:hypothetical protein